MEEGILEQSNKVLLHIEGSTGAVVYFSYLWTEHPDFPEVDIVDVDVVEDTVSEYLLAQGIVSVTMEYPILVLDAGWYPDIGYSGTVYWYVKVGYNQLHISPISGEVIGGITTYTAIPTATGITDSPVPGALDALLPMGIILILPSSFSLGLAGYIIVKNRQSRRIIGSNKT